MIRPPWRFTKSSASELARCERRGERGGHNTPRKVLQVARKHKSQPLKAVVRPPRQPAEAEKRLHLRSLPLAVPRSARGKHLWELLVSQVGLKQAVTTRRELQLRLFAQSVRCSNVSYASTKRARGGAQRAWVLLLGRCGESLLG